MEVGNVISQKIRSAIKAKLVDLGAYVDDELPDYIMVMVANKKDRDQMTEDLNLFLGNNTEKFTGWLHALLEKLQSITADQPKPNEPHVFSENPADVSSIEVNDSIDSKPKPTNTEEPELKLQAGDDFDDEVIENRQIKAHLRSKETRPPVRGRVEKKISTFSDKSADVGSSKSNKSPKKLKPIKTVTFASGTVSHGASRSSQRRKGPTSTVGAVLRHDVEDDDADEYDPLRPAIGNVASVVRAPPRRSSVPAKLQANKSLLMKAVSDAHTSIAAAEKRSLGRRDKDKKSVKERIGRRQKSSIQSRLGGRRHEERDGGERAPEEHRSIRVVSRSRREEKQGGESRKRAQSPSTGEAASGGSSPRAAPPREDDDKGEPDSYILDISIPDDQRLIQCSDSDDGFGGRRQGNGLHSVPVEAGYLEELVESGADNSDGDEGPAPSHGALPQAGDAAPHSPKFVVTLDGVDPALLKQKRYEEKQERGLKRGHQSADLDDAQEEDSVFSIEGEFEYEEEDSPEKRSKPLEKCKFWPGCKNGDSCPFHHPVTNCTNFPRCKFGDKCLYIHPQCKFDASCTRPTCPFTHSSRRVPQPALPPTVIVQPIKVPLYSMPRAAFPERPKAPAHPRQITCRFFPQCTNMNCPFNHPKPCRFGVSCNQKATCLFGHPDLPPKSQLSWSKQGESLSPIESLS